MRRTIKNITLTDSQVNFLKNNYTIMTYSKMSKILCVHHSKLIENARLLGIEKRKKTIDFNNNGFFDADKFFNHYSF